MKCCVKGCNNRARYNIQKLYHLYQIDYDEDGDADYEDIKDWDSEEENDHYCVKHANEELLLDSDLEDEVEE